MGAQSTQEQEPERAVEVLELALGENRFAVDIRKIDEIVERKPLTPIPNSADHVAGVMDLRGTTTKIIDPKPVLGVEEGDSGTSSDAGNRVIVLDLDEESQVGWLVDGVYEVFHTDQYEFEPSEENPAIEGVIRREESFVMWVEPMSVNEREGSNGR